MWCQWQLVPTRMKVSKWLKGGAKGLKIQNINNLVYDKNLLLKNSTGDPRLMQFSLLQFFHWVRDEPF